VLTLRKALNDLSALQLAAGKDRKISNAIEMLGKSIMSILWQSFFAINYTKFHFQLLDF